MLKKKASCDKMNHVKSVVLFGYVVFPVALIKSSLLLLSRIHNYTKIKIPFVQIMHDKKLI